MFTIDLELSTIRSDLEIIRLHSMAPSRQGDRKRPSGSGAIKHSRTRQPVKQPDRNIGKFNDNADSSPIDFSIPIPISLQQLLLDTFKTALLAAPPSRNSSPTASQDSNEPSQLQEDPNPLDTKTLIQTIKSHLYQRDFDAAFTDAGEDLLRAYALRWSAARALGYAGLFKGVLSWIRDTKPSNDTESTRRPDGAHSTRAVCIGGGAGAEIVALAAAWRDLASSTGVDVLGPRVGRVSLDKSETGDATMVPAQEDEAQTQIHAGAGSPRAPGLSVAAVDIADWSSVVDRLSRSISSADVPAASSSRYRPPLVSRKTEGGVSVSFRRADILALSESELKDVILGQPGEASATENLLVTLMFTLNELFTTSMAKTTGFLLCLTDVLPSGAVLLVVDSPGSYSTLKLGKGKDGAAQERKYPMKFLLDHTLLSVAEGKWERVYTQDSRWWRREAARLRYDVGEGAGLEDMRFQVHVYRRT